MGVSKLATLSEIKAAYKKRAHQTHPDKGGDPTGEAFREVNKAYQILSDPTKRQLYDDTGHDPEDTSNSLDLFAAFFATEPRAADIRDVLEISKVQQRDGCVLQVMIEPQVMCNGHVQSEEEEVEVAIPPGVQHGAFIPILNKGCQENGKLPGDWVFVICIQKDQNEVCVQGEEAAPHAHDERVTQTLV